ncbi:MAG TPA: hypothetical protein VF591_14505 [Pyrinomonadaceae bacterium]
MKIEHRSYVDILTERRDCAAACFCTYTFDPQFFEEQVLAPILGVVSDPFEMPMRFLEEGRVRCREVPVICLASGEKYRGGQRMPYGLGLVSGRTFHPKISWLLFPDESIVVVGSGNLTREGIGVQSEMFVALRLSYSEAADRGVLKGLSNFVAACGPLLDRPAGRLEDFLDHLRRLCPLLEDHAASVDLQFLHTESGATLLAQISEAVAGSIERISVISPFFEEDGSWLEGSALGELARLAKASGGASRLQLAVPWADSNSERPAQPVGRVDDLLNRLCCFRNEDEQGEGSFGYWTPRRRTERTIQYLDRYGRQSVLPLEDAERLVASRDAWPVDPVTVYAPAELIAALGAEGLDAEMFLFPDWRVEGGRVVRRPLHAKCFAFVARERGVVNTWLFVGSANASRRALLEPGGNVEAGFLLKLPGEVALEEISPEVISCPRERMTMEERTYPPQGPNLALMLESAVYSARERVLRVGWDQGRAAGREVTLLYLQKVLWAGGNPPAEQTFVDVDLALASCELTLKVGEASFAVPITVIDPEALPANPSLGKSTFEELIALYGGRMSSEKLARWRERAAEGAMADGALASFFGERFQPVDVFRAWFGMKAELEVGDLSIGGLKVLLDGPQGVRTVWRLLLEAADKGNMPREEAWFYGLELYRTLSMVQTEESSRFAEEKRSLLEGFLEELRAGLSEGRRAVSDRALARRLTEFYLRT